MNKTLLLEEIFKALKSLHQGAVDAAKQACDTATNKSTVAENKYDTFGLEASYLARGQAKRVASYATDLAVFKKLSSIDFTENMPIAIGAMIILENELAGQQRFFLSPTTGGLKVTFKEQDITLISCSSSLGASLLGHFVGDEIEIEVAGKKTCYEILAIH